MLLQNPINAMVEAGTMLNSTRENVRFCFVVKQIMVCWLTLALLLVLLCSVGCWCRGGGIQGEFQLQKALTVRFDSRCLIEQLLYLSRLHL